MTRTPAQAERQERRDWGRTGQYETMNRCYKCNRSAGYDYWSTKYTDAQCSDHRPPHNFGDAGLVLCPTCCTLADAKPWHDAYTWLTTITADRPVADCGLAGGCYHSGCTHKGIARAAAQRGQRAAVAEVKADARQAVRDEKEAKRLAGLAAWVRCECRARSCVGWAWRDAHAWGGKSDPYAPEDACGRRANKRTGLCADCGDWCR